MAAPDTLTGTIAFRNLQPSQHLRGDRRFQSPQTSNSILRSPSGTVISPNKSHARGGCYLLSSPYAIASLQLSVLLTLLVS